MIDTLAKGVHEACDVLDADKRMTNEVVANAASRLTVEDMIALNLNNEIENLAKSHPQGCFAI